MIIRKDNHFYKCRNGQKALLIGCLYGWDCLENLLPDDKFFGNIKIPFSSFKYPDLKEVTKGLLKIWDIHGKHIGHDELEPSDEQFDLIDDWKEEIADE